MGVTFDRDMRIAGLRPSVFKAALRAYVRTENRASFLELKSIVPMQRDAAILLEECLDRGLIDPSTFKVTDRGMTVARSKVVARTPFEKARGVLSDLLDRIDQLNADPEALSMLRRCAGASGPRFHIRNVDVAKHILSCGCSAQAGRARGALFADTRTP